MLSNTIFDITEVVRSVPHKLRVFKITNSFIMQFFSECFCAFDSSHIICSTITRILINVNKKNIVNYKSQNINLFTTSVMSNMVLLW